MPGNGEKRKGRSSVGLWSRSSGRVVQQSQAERWGIEYAVENMGGQHFGRSGLRDIAADKYAEPNCAQVKTKLSRGPPRFEVRIRDIWEDRSG